MSGLRIATAQFPVSNDPAINCGTIMDQIEIASGLGARAVLFPECALTGYPGHQGLRAGDIDWSIVRREIDQLQIAAARRGLWLIVGAARTTSRGKAKLANSLLVISPEGEIVANYDKRRLYGRDFDAFE